MKKLKYFGWVLGLLLACGLVVLVRWHAELQGFAVEHRGIAFYAALGLLLTIPARIMGLAATYLIELLVVGWSRSSLKMLFERDASVRLDILSIVIMLLLPQRHLRWLLSFGLLYLIDVYATKHLDVTHVLTLWELQVVGFLLLQSLVRYWLHRLEHTIPVLWAAHKFHHSAERMTILTSARSTQFTAGVETALVIVPMALLTSPAAEPAQLLASPLFPLALVIFAYQTFSVINGYLCHSNLSTDYGWIGRWLIVSPRMHRLHHATTPAYYNKNFSNDLVVWDRVFGTYVTCDAQTDIATIPVGLEDNPFNSQPTLRALLREYFVTTYLVIWQELKLSARRHMSNS